VSHDQTSEDLLLERNLLLVEDLLTSVQELGRHVEHVILLEREVDARASGVNRLDDPILEVTGQNESAIVGEFFNESSESGLHALRVSIVEFVKDHDLVATREGNCTGEVPNPGSERVDVSILRAVHHDPVGTDLIA